VPLFLGTGGHLRRDLPALVEAAKRAHPALAIRLHAAIGEHAAVVEAMARAAVAAAFGE
jgi:sirohydrochlorin cobaltochelatase